MKFGREQFVEIFTTLGANKLRTILTGFAVGWGVLILVVLLSAGMGVRNGISVNFLKSGLNNSSVEVEFGYTSEPYGGKPKWTDVALTQEQLPEMTKPFERELNTIVPYQETYGQISSGERSEEGLLKGVGVGYNQIIAPMIKGGSRSRFINDRDEIEQRKVIVLSDHMARTLFDSEQEALGKTAFFNKIPFVIVGVYVGSNGQWSENIIPLSTMQTLKLKGGNKPFLLSGFHALAPGIRNSNDADDLEGRLLIQLARLQGANPEDNSLLSVHSQASMLSIMGKVLSGINTFLWVLGLSTLVIGVVGVINIMQIAITERKREIGIRKALGAKPRDIIAMVLVEAVFITLISGLMGLVVSVGLMAGADKLMTMMGIGATMTGDQMTYIFLKPIIDLPTAVATLITMVLGGVVAGYLPARKAVAIPTVEAMRH